VRRTVLLVPAIVLMLIMASGVALAASRIQITGLLCNPSGDDNKNLNGEYVLLHNTSNKPVGLGGWSIHDNKKRHFVRFPPGYTLGSDSAVRVHSGRGNPHPGHLYLRLRSSVWNNPPRSDTATLSDRAGRVVSTKRCEYGQATPKDTGLPDILTHSGQNLMAALFNLLTNLLIVGAVLAMIVFVAVLMFQGGSGIEVVIRTMAAAVGFLIYAGSQAVGLSIPELMLSSIHVTNPESIVIVGVLFPGLAGMAVAWFCLQSIRKIREVGARLVILISTFVVALFGDVYVASFQTSDISQQGINVVLLPNLTFTISMGLYFILRYTKEKDGQEVEE
jgi:lamin tail-like protein